MFAAQLNRVFRSIFFVTFLIIAAFTQCSCSKKEDPKGEAVIYDACRRAFPVTLTAFEDAVKERAPARCQFLDRVYDIQESETDITGICDPQIVLGDNETMSGCFTRNPPVLILRSDRSPSHVINTAVHEWLHILAFCVYGNEDREHMRGQLWEHYMKELSAEAQAAAAAPVGRCL